MILRSIADVGYILFLAEFLSNQDVKEGRRDRSKRNVTVTLSIYTQFSFGDAPSLRSNSCVYSLIPKTDQVERMTLEIISTCPGLIYSKL